MKRLSPRKSSRRREDAHQSVVGGLACDVFELVPAQVRQLSAGAGRPRSARRGGAARAGARSHLGASNRSARRRLQPLVATRVKRRGPASAIRGIDGSTTGTVAGFDGAHAALSSSSGREDSDGEVGRTASLDELDQRVQVIASVLGDASPRAAARSRIPPAVRTASGRPHRHSARLFSCACLLSAAGACSYLWEPSEPAAPGAGRPGARS